MASSGRSVPAERDPAETLRSDFAMRLRGAEAIVIREPDEDPDAHASRLDHACGQVRGIVRNASETASEYAARIRQAITSAGQSARETKHDLTAYASIAADRLSDRARHDGGAINRGVGSVAQSIRQTIASITANPFALGALAAVVGLVAGALIPATEQEEKRVLGGTADRLRSAGRDLAQDVLDRGGRVASGAIGALQDSAATHGLTTDKPVGEVAADIKSGALVDNVKTVASEALESGQASADANRRHVRQ
jgi:ElaB/YqjD/DUF883 family membrane-anchored ribosome-binding protein